jgi:hypothetical protein
VLKTRLNSLNDNLTGCLAEYKFCVAAMSKGFKISMPLLDSSPYDCILESDFKLYKIQIKHVGLNRFKGRHNSIQVSLRRTNDFYTQAEVDYFAIYFEERNGFFIIRNYQQKSIRINSEGKYKNNFNNFEVFY